MYVLDDLAGFSARARELLNRTGRREPVGRAAGSRLPTDLLRVPDRAGRLIPAPPELVIRREGFADRYGGLRYDVRRSALLGSQRYDTVRHWDFDLVPGDRIWADHRGWFFEWYGEQVSSPVTFLLHTDGRVGVGHGGPPFVEVASSVTQLVESHAVLDLVAGWDPVPGSGLEPWVSGHAGLDRPVDRIAGLAVVPEASGRCDRWLLSDCVAVNRYRRWSAEGARTLCTRAWTLGADGRRQLTAALGQPSESGRAPLPGGVGSVPTKPPPPT